MCRAAKRLLCRSPRLASVMSFSANGRSSLALAVVVSMRPWRNRLSARLRSRASLCSVVRPSARPLFPCLMLQLPGGSAVGAPVLLVVGFVADHPPQRAPLVRLQRAAKAQPVAGQEVADLL